MLARSADRGCCHSVVVSEDEVVVSDAVPLPRFAELVLEVVRLVPTGKVLTYGDVAEYLGEGGPRQVGSVLARHGGGVPWWRVLRADGTPAPQVSGRALEHYAREGTPLRPGSERVDLRRARWDGD